MVFHDILSDLEINHLIEESRPNLSRSRYATEDIQEGLSSYEFSHGNKVKIVHKEGSFLILILFHNPNYQ